MKTIFRIVVMMILATGLMLGQVSPTFGNVGVLMDQTFVAGTYLLPPIPVNSGQFAAMNYYYVEYSPLAGASFTSCNLAINSDLTGTAITPQNCTAQGNAANGPIVANNISVQVNVQGGGVVRIRLLAGMGPVGGGGGSGGGVSSVGLSLPPGLFSVAGSPVTGSGVLSATFVTIGPHLYLGNNTSGATMAGMVQPGFTDLTGSASLAQLPFTYTTSNGATKLVTASTFSGLAGSGVCLDGNLNLTTIGCTGGGMIWPGSAGIMVYAGGNAYGTSLTAPTSAIVGISDTQTLTNKSISGAEITSGTVLTAFLPSALANQTSINGLNITASTGTLTVANGKTLTANSTLTLAGSDGNTLTVSNTGTAITTGTSAAGDLNGNFPTLTVVKIEGGAIPLSAALVGTNGSGQLIANTGTLANNISGTAAGLISGGTIAGLSAGCLSVTGLGVVQSSGSSCSAGGGMVYPSGNGFAVVAGGTNWGTTIAVPTGAVVGAGQGNSYTTGLQSFSLATMALPSIASYAPVTAGLFGYDSTNNRAVLGNGANTSYMTWILSAPTSGNIASFSGTLGQETDSGVVAVNVVTQTSNGSANQIATYSTTNKVLVPATTLPAAAEPAHTGDATNTAGSLAMTVSKINGTAFSGTANDLVAFGAGGIIPLDTNVQYTNLTTQTSNGAVNQVCTYTGANKICVPASVSNSMLANSTIGVGGSSNQITSTTTSIALGASTTLAIANPFIFPGKHTASAGTTAAASMNIPSGVAPTSPTSGDIWNLSGVHQYFDGTSTLSLVRIAASVTAGSCAQFSGTTGLVISIACGSVGITGTPVSGQAAIWTSATQIQGVAVTGTGSVVMANSPSLTAPNIGAATATTLNALTLTAQSVGFTVAGGTSSKTLTVDATIAISALAPLNNPTFTGTVGGITATMIGLGNVTNNVQTLASVMPNTAPGSGYLPFGNGTAYVAAALTGDSTVSSLGVMHNVGLTFSGTAILLGTAPASGQCLEYNGTNITGITCGGGSSTINNASQYSTPYYSASGSANTISGVAAPTSPNGIAQMWVSTPSGGAATAGTWAIPGVGVDAQTGTSYTIPVSDDVHLVTGNNAAATAWTGFTLANNYAFSFENIGAGLITYTPASGQVNGTSTQIIPQNWFGFHYTDNTNTFMPVMPTLAAFPNTSSGHALAFNSATGVFSSVTLGVTSIVFSTPLTGGTITGTGTVGCPTCVLASSPGVGIAHFAGATQTVTSSLVSLTSDITGILPLANATQLFQVNPQTGTYAVQTTDFADCTTIVVPSGTFSVTLIASGSQPASGQCIHVLNYGSGVVTIARNGQNINGAAANLTLAAGSSSAPTGVRIVSDGSNYFAQPLGGSGGGGAGVSSFSGDGALLSNSGSTGAVTATLANAAAFSVWGNATGSSAAPGYTTNPSVTSLTLNGSTSGACALSVTPTGGTLNMCAGGTITSSGLLTVASGLTFSGTSGANTTIATSTANANIIFAPNGTGSVFFPDGSATQAGIQFTGGTAGAGLTQIAATSFGFTNGTSFFTDFSSSSGMSLKNTGAYCWSISSSATTGPIACLTSPGTTNHAQLILSDAVGGDNTSPTANAILRASGVSTGTNLTGTDFIISPGQGSGNAAPSRMILDAPAFSATSGGTLQTLVTRSEWGNAKALSTTSATATTIFTPTIAPSLGMLGGTLYYSIKITDGTDVCAVTGEVNWGLIIKAGTYTGSVSSPLSETKAQSGSNCATFSTTWAWSTDNLQVTPTFATMTPTTAYIVWSTTNQGDVSLP